MSDWSHLRSEFYWVYEGNVEKSYRDTRHHLAGQSALLILEGSIRVTTDKAVVVAEKGQWCFPTQRQRHQLLSDQTRLLSLHFKFFWPGGQPLFDTETAIVVDASKFPLLEKKARSLLRTLKKQIPGAANNLLMLQGSLSTHIRLQSSFMDWLVAYADCMLGAGFIPSRLGEIDSRVLHAVQMLDERPLRLPFITRNLASEVGLSSSQLDRLFTQQFNVTPRQYFDNRKLEQAKEMLRSNAFPIKQIAYELGFQSMPYFSRWFRQKTRHSPRSFHDSENVFSSLD